MLIQLSFCQRLDSRQLTQKKERRRRESPPEAKGERSEPFAGGAHRRRKRFREVESNQNYVKYSHIKSRLR